MKIAFRKYWSSKTLERKQLSVKLMKRLSWRDWRIDLASLTARLGDSERAGARRLRCFASSIQALKRLKHRSFAVRGGSEMCSVRTGCLA